MRADPIESMAVAVPNRLEEDPGVEKTCAAVERPLIAVKPIRQKDATHKVQNRRRSIKPPFAEASKERTTPTRSQIIESGYPAGN
ncbi:MAG TPA: hypothetical protein VMP12_01365 [Candidatus Sulfotelmatobacter sp.]|nr:hypothetical protein [Candidatus Sulfotelmatobacter sp.]